MLKVYEFAALGRRGTSVPRRLAAKNGPKSFDFQTATDGHSLYNDRFETYHEFACCPKLADASRCAVAGRAASNS